MPQSPWQRLSCQMIRSSVNRPRNDAEKFKPPAKKKRICQLFDQFMMFETDVQIGGPF